MTREDVLRARAEWQAMLESQGDYSWLDEADRPAIEDTPIAWGHNGGVWATKYADGLVALALAALDAEDVLDSVAKGWTTPKNTAPVKAALDRIRAARGNP